jgi:ATP-dependent helicase HrpB
MVAVAADAGEARMGARIAVVLSEPGLGGTDTDLRERLRGLDRDRSSRADDSRRLAERWARAATAVRGSKGGPVDIGRLLAEAFPERIARARGKPGEVLLASGRGAFIDPTDPLASEPWLAVADLGGGDARDRIRLAAPVDVDGLEARFTVEDRLTREPSRRLFAVVAVSSLAGQSVLKTKPISGVWLRHVWTGGTFLQPSSVIVTEHPGSFMRELVRQPWND